MKTKFTFTCYFLLLALACKKEKVEFYPPIPPVNSDSLENRKRLAAYMQKMEGDHYWHLDGVRYNFTWYDSATGGFVFDSVYTISKEDTFGVNILGDNILGFKNDNYIVSYRYINTAGKFGRFDSIISLPPQGRYTREAFLYYYYENDSIVCGRHDIDNWDSSDDHFTWHTL